MDWLRQLDAEKFLLFTLVLTRVSGLVMTAPIFGATDSPVRVRALLAMALALLVMPSQWHLHFDYPGTTPMYLVLVGGELLIGACLGLGITVLLSGIQLAGDLISRAGGMTVSELFDPTFNSDVPMFSRLLLLVATAVFACMGGHRVVMAGLLDTFQAIPPGSSATVLLGTPTAAAGGHSPFLQSLAETFVTLMAQSFQLGVRACVPVVVAALLATLIIGLVGRTLPQLNILAVGFSLNALLTFAVMFISLGATFWVFQEYLQPALEALMEVLKVPLESRWFV
jgi:flagellar biosynthetic protein FliR